MNAYDNFYNDFNLFIELFNQFWILKPFIKEEIDKIVQLVKYDICINIRRGDKLTLESVLPVKSIDSYIDEIKKINIKNPKIFHTSDEYDSFLEIQNKTPDWDITTLTSPDEKGYFLRDINMKDEYYNINHVMKFMIQLHIMKSSDYFIGTLSTNVGYIVQLLRQIIDNPKNIYTL